ncbi:MAG: hypothetical protein OXL97_04285 [Chloroflexota bacterium]|nr:hypothetical protein [Chloroflexota bacterium]MDE2883929.1 hypothetical protein [Chloroflexota bacterium]
MHCLRNIAVFGVLWICAFMTMDLETLKPTTWVYWLVMAAFGAWVLRIACEIIQDAQTLLKRLFGEEEQ